MADLEGAEPAASPNLLGRPTPSLLISDNGTVLWKVAGFLETQRAQWQRGPQKFPIISRPTPRLLSFALCLEWINDIYNTPDTGCLECYRPQASVNATTPGIDRKHIHCRNMLEIRIRYNYALKIVNKRRRNFLNKIQNVFINGKQVKTVKIIQIIPWFPRFYATKTTRQLTASLQPTCEQWPLHGDNAYQWRFQAAANSLAAWKWVVDISAFQYSL